MVSTTAAVRSPLIGAGTQRLSSRSVDEYAPAFPAQMVARWSTPKRLPPRFGDLVWETTGLEAKPITRRSVDFTQLRPEWALYAREVIWWRLNGADVRRDRVVGGQIVTRATQRASSVEGLFQAFKKLQLADEAFGLGLPNQWTETETDRLREWVREEYPHAYIATIVQALYLLSPVLTLRGIDHDPIGSLGLYEWAGCAPPSQIVTGSALEPRVFAPLVRAAMAYIENYSSDILAARRYQRDREYQVSNKLIRKKSQCLPVAERFDPSERGETMNDLLRFVAERGALPASTVDFGRSKSATLSYRTLAVLLDVPSNSPSGPVKERAAQLVDSGVPLAPGMLPIPISDVVRADGSTGPWRQPFCWTSLHVEVQILRDACVTLVLAFTAMRGGEVSRLPRNGWKTTWHGRAAITSPLIKNHDGEDAKWWAVELVILACEILEETLEDPEANFLLGARVQRVMTALNDSDDDEADMTTSAVYASVQRFVKHVNTSPSLLDGERVPVGENETIKPHALRHTLASIANMAVLGDLAMQQQCKHAQATITWGYMGNAGTGKWVSLLIDTHTNEGLNQALSVMAGVWSGAEELGGPAGRKLDADIRRALDYHGAPDFDAESEQSETQQFMGIVASSRELTGLVRSIAQSFHVGVVAGCYHDRNKALCGDGAFPLLAACVPERCGNVVLDFMQRELFEDVIAEIDELLADRKVKGDQREILERRRDSIRRQVGRPNLPLIAVNQGSVRHGA